MNLNDKKGVSGVVTAVLLILLVIAAIGILWVVVQNFVDEGAEQISGATACQTTTLEVTGNTTTDIIVKRLFGSSDLESIRVIVDGTVKTTKDITAGDFGIGETKSIAVTLANGNEVQVGAVFSGTPCQLSAAFIVG